MKNTKRALLLSALAIVMSIAMLIGSTFAWFTDSASTAVNTIQSGTLDVALEYSLDDGATWKNAEGETLDFVKADGAAANEAVLWEPNCTYELPLIRVRNNGNLALKYEISVIGATGDLKLFDVISFTAAIDGAAEVALDTFTGHLDAKDASSQILIKGHMDKNAGNDYQGLEIKNIAINVLATQYTYESDSNDNQYDKDAVFAAKDATDLKKLLAKGGNIKLVKDITTTETFEVPAGVTAVLDLGGNSITSTTTTIKNEGNLVIKGGTLETTTVNGKATINNKGTLTIEDTEVIGAPIDSTGYPAYAITSSGNLTVKEGTAITADRGCVYLSGTGETVINGGTFTNNDIAAKRAGNPFTSHVVVVGYGANNKLTINDGTFKHLHTSTSGGVVINNMSAVTVEVNGGNFSGGNYFGKWDNLSDYGYGSTTTPFSVKGGTFTGLDKNYVAAGCVVINNDDGTYTVYGSESTMTVEDGAVLDLGGVKFPGTIALEGDVTIKGDTEIKTLSAKNGANITIEDGKTLSLNNFSFGNKNNPNAEYVIEGGSVKASYGFFQHGKYIIDSVVETGYMYYSFNSDIVVKGTVHSQGVGDGLDYIRGKVTVANGGKIIHEKALWVGQPASWGAMSSTLIVEEGGYVQAGTLRVYTGSKVQIDAANAAAGEVTNVVCNSITIDGGVVEAINSQLTATVSGNKIVLN